MATKTNAPKAKTPKIKRGSQVTWESQAQGFWKKKTGKVVEVVPAGKPPKCNKLEGSGGPRKVTSYVVQVPGAGKAKPTYYWPRSEALSLVA